MAIYFYGCMTMDGYLADSQHQIDWLHQIGDVEETSYADFYRQMDVTIMGKRTFEAIAQLPDVDHIYPTTENYVLTHATHLSSPSYQARAEDVVSFVKRFDDEKNIFVVGGNSLVAPLLDANLFDKLIIQVAPIILGAGIPLFTQSAYRRFYHLEELHQFGQFAEMVFSKKE